MPFIKRFLEFQNKNKEAIIKLEDNWKFKITFYENSIIKLSVFYKDYNLETLSNIKRINFKKISFNQQIKKNNIVLFTKDSKIIIYQNPFRLTILKKINKKWEKVIEDRPTGAWYWNMHSKNIRHFQLRKKNQKIFGLGEKSGSIERSFRSFSMSQKDSLGYNAEKSDPLYKSFPWLYIIDSKNRYKDFGLLYNQYSSSKFDIGSEHSNYHQHYRLYETKQKGFNLLVFLKQKNISILSNLNNLLGKRYLPPKWSLGFQFSSMDIADSKDSPNLYLDFVSKCNENKIPISAIHFSSGYTLENNKRNIFIWNKKKFPNPKKFLNQLRLKGIYTVANLKPVLLINHPFYKEAVRKDLFINSNFNKPLIIQFWGGKGSILDFTKDQTCNWWKENLKKYIFQNGFDAIWNDNNEYDLEDYDSYSYLNNIKVNSNDLSSYQGLLMSKSSYYATSNYYPKRRNYGVTRSGAIGIQNWVETWTGDNYTSWHSLKWSLSIGLGLSLSGVGLFGHDIGGFTGPKSEKELLIRSFQLMLFHPRFLMNSWKSNNSNNLQNINSPLMHKDMLPEIKKIIQLRYKILPVIYSAVWRYYKFGEPIVRPMFLDFDEKEYFRNEEIFSINENIILVPILEKNCKNKEIFLPFCKEGWYDFYSMEYISSGGRVFIETPIHKAIIIVRGATVLPLSDKKIIKKAHFSPINKILIFPSKIKILKTQKNLPMIFDDGWSIKYEKNNSLVLTPVISINKNNIELDFLSNGFQKIKEKSINIITTKNYNVKVKKYSKLFKN